MHHRTIHWPGELQAVPLPKSQRQTERGSKLARLLGLLLLALIIVIPDWGNGGKSA